MADGNSKRKRRDKKGRPRGSQVQTGHRGAHKTSLTRLQLALLGKGPTEAAAARLLRSSRKQGATR